MLHDRLEPPTRQLVAAQQVLIGVALLELGASNGIEIAHQILSMRGELENYYNNEISNIKSDVGAFKILIQ
ncbi:hypothetical protein THZG08_40090 [Vibrio owensii]|nr:hypothetical protein THZG08_40090 [Vibrio owensii]CAH1575838.1 hypothetical protein THOA03_40090 [Vibrio owensii]